MGVDIYGKLTNNSAAVFPAKWYPTRGDREKYVDVRVELVGTIDRRTGYPIQNLRASTKGTAVRLAQSLPVEEKQEMSFLGFWWLVDEVRYDLSAVNPQAAAFGDPMKNAVVELTLIGSGRKAE